MELISCLNDSGEFFTNDGDSEFFSRSISTGMLGEEGTDEKEQLRILNHLFGTPGIPDVENRECEDAGKGHVSKVDQGEHFSQIPHSRGTLDSSVSSDNKAECNNRKPMLTRRRSNPFYSPSRQIMDLVKKKRNPRAPSLNKSQTSATVLTLNHFCGRYKLQDKSKSDR